MANTKSIDFERSSSQCAYISDFPFNTLTSITIEFWINLETATGIQQFPLTQWGYATSDRSIYIEVTTLGALRIAYCSDGISSAGSGTTQWTSDSTVMSAEAGNWVHLAFAINISGKTAVVYKDGSSISITKNRENGTSIFNADTNVVIGGRYSGSAFDGYLDGKMDDVRIWNDIRTSTEINDNMDAELDGDETGLIGYWKFNDSLLDETSNDYDLTNLNSAVYSTDVPFTGGGGGSPFIPKITMF